MAVDLKVSIPTFNEISAALEAKGVKLTDDSVITLGKDTRLERPLDWRLIQVRKDSVVEASKVWNDENPQTFIECADAIYQYILYNTTPKKD